jgi:uncharacterized integral membrane protein
MKSFRLKLILLCIVTIFIILVIYQNRAVFTHAESFAINLLVWEYETPPILLSMCFVAFFLVGILISYFHGLSSRFKAKNEIKNHLKRISKLEEEIKVLKRVSPQQASPPSQETSNV